MFNKQTVKNNGNTTWFYGKYHNTDDTWIRSSISATKTGTKIARFCHSTYWYIQEKATQRNDRLSNLPEGRQGLWQCPRPQ
ncbi:hypothetical protein CCP4SC76_500003 [Gammaproteobacteria bacterium]